MRLLTLRPTAPGRALRRHARVIAACHVLLLLLALDALQAAEVGSPFAPGEAFAASARLLHDAAGDLAAAGDAPAEVLLDDVSYTWDERGRLTRRTHSIYRIIAAAAIEDWSTVEAVWAPWYEERPQIRARVVTPDGREHVLDPRTIAESPEAADEPDMFTDRRYLSAPLPAVAAGVVVETEVVTRESAPFFAAGSSHRHYLARPVPLHRGRLVLDAPAALPLRHEVARRDDVAARREAAGGRTRLVFDYATPEPPEFPEPGLPSDVAPWPAVTFSTAASWNAIAADYSRVVDERVRAADLRAIQSAVPRRAGGTQLDRIGDLLAWIHREIRYTGLELGTASIVPATPAEVLARRFGDCKDQSALLVALLRAEEIPAYVALLDGSGGYDVDPDLPGMGHFDHAIVVVPGSPALWIDPTVRFARPGHLATPAQDRLALIASPNTRGLVRTWSAAPADNRLVETREVELADYGAGRIVETSEFHGVAEVSQRGWAALVEESERRDSFADYVREVYLAKEIGEYTNSRHDDLSQPFTTRVEARGAGRAWTDLDEAAVYVPLSSLVSSLPDVLLAVPETPRAQPFQFVPYVTEWHYRIAVPDGYVPRALPESRTRPLGTITLSESYVHADGYVDARFRIDSGVARLTAAQVTATQEAVAALLEEDEVVAIAFDSSAAAALAAGRPVEAVAAALRLANQPDGSVASAVRTAATLLEVGMVEEARRHARRAVERDPTSWLAHWSLATTLERDGFGRHFGKGYDHAGARRELERAHELAPDNDLVLGDLAILLDYSPAGEQYAKGADLDRSIELYRQLRQDFGHRGYDVNLLNALFFAQRWSELADFARELSPAADRNAWLLVAIALAESPEAALGEANRLASDATERGELLAVAARQLAGAHAYPQAAKLARRAAASGGKVDGYIALADLYERTRTLEEIPADPADPRDIVRALMVLAANESAGAAEVAAVYHEDLLRPSGEDSETWRGFLTGMRQALRLSPGVPIRAAAELGLAGVEVAVQGSDELGYRVEYRSRLAGVDGRTVMYCLQTPAGVRIRAVDGQDGELGQAAWALLEQGNLPAARQWLDWARKGMLSAFGDDPLSGDAMARLWVHGATPPENEVRVAAATLLTRGERGSGIAREHWDAALKTLEAARAAAVEPSRQIALDVALLDPLLARERVDALPVARRLHELHPRSDAALAWLVRALSVADDEPAIGTLLRNRLAARPDDSLALIFAASQALDDGATEAATGYYDRLEELQRHNSGSYNAWSWSMLFTRPISPRALEIAEKGARLSNYTEYPVLHTLATVHAELDHPLQAWQLAVQGIGMRYPSEPDSPDWYILGRIAETYGLVADARTYYERVIEREKVLDEDSRWTTRELATTRLGALGDSPRVVQGKRRSKR